MKVLARETSKTIFSWVRNPLPAPRSVLETVPTAPGGLRHSSSQPAGNSNRELLPKEQSTARSGTSTFKTSVREMSPTNTWI